MIPSGTTSVGLDLADVGRIRTAIARHGERFLRKVLTDREAAYCLSRPDPAPHVAARFAAKEAVVKCLGGGCTLREIEVWREGSGAPRVVLSGRALERAAGRRVIVSLTHLDHLAAAVAALVDAPTDPGSEEASPDPGS